MGKFAVPESAVSSSPSSIPPPILSHLPLECHKFCQSPAVRKPPVLVTKMHKLCLFAVLLVLTATSVASTQGEETSADFQAQPPAFCLEPPYTGPCKAMFIRYFFNASSGYCESFVYGGCEGNQNRFWDQEECAQTCGQKITALAQPPAFCLEPPYTGPCKAMFIRYFFNASSGFCETFVYGGCGGNQNRFWDQEECVQTCGQKITSLDILTPVRRGHAKV
ncbi:PREDICTED: boophilin-H2-like [Chinchilla lanigera]|uniref:boophilin-H2-like n=1 Tax=Chinchilla lanigera TaxID=34839 RepID=UPI00038E9FF0|nr:PREDICTED: boophilin-H2-like [Chinchilla lanigera]